MKCVWPLPPNPEANRVDAAFLDPSYVAWRRRAGMTPDEHPGVDLNLAHTAGNGDYGYPVVAVLPGEVVHAKKHRVWGNVVMIRHYEHVAQYYKHPVLYSQYAHLAFIVVRVGQHILPGEPVGSIGRGDAARFRSHLHFELRCRRLAADHWPGNNRAAIVAGYIDPVAFLKEHAEYANRLIFDSGRVFEGTASGVKVDYPRVVVKGGTVDIGLPARIKERR